MNNPEVIGNAILVVIVLGSFYAVISKFTEPINELKIVIQELKVTIEALKDDYNTHNKRLEKHGIEIDDLKERVYKIETKIINLEEHK